MKKYARLIVVTGANVQPGQIVRLYINADQYEFAAILTEECYKAGASRVDIEWAYQPTARLDYLYRTEESLSSVLSPEEEKYKLMTEELPCRIFIISDDPDGLSGIDLEKMSRSRAARAAVIKPYRDAIENKHQWTIAAIPSFAWAKKVFPGLGKKAGYEKLWDCILRCARVNGSDAPETEWQYHNELLSERSEKLNSLHLAYLTYKSSNGTDFRVDLIPATHWCGGTEVTKQGIAFNPNLPTEEIFISPMKGKAEGTLVATKPLSYDGQLIEDFSFFFKDGKAVDCKAKKGEKLLKEILSMDDGASYLGEVALIPKESPVNQTGVLYYETLFDENACCHVALGAGFNDTVDGYLEKTNEECKAIGINDSIIHVDFMIGCDDLCITGHTMDGREVPIFINGTWAEGI